jgi:polyhydroxyalkanoate synthesis regulator phasin
MNDLPDFFKKAFYLGVGVASYAGEHAGNTVVELQERAQQLANEMIRRGEISTEEANQWLKQFNPKPTPVSVEEVPYPDHPQTIELISGDEEDTPSTDEDLHTQVAELEKELRRLQDEEIG